MFVSILHADADCFFASVEQRDQPRLRGRPTMVATWVVMAASYEARAFGIHSAMHATEARRLCPDVVAVEPRSDAYAEASAAMFAVFEAASPVVEPAGIEEAFIEGPPELGARLRAAVRREVGLPVTVGVAGTKIAAKMASRAAKPDGLRIVADERAFLHAHRVEALWGIGKATAARLHARGIETVGEAAALSEPELIALLGTGNGRRVHALVNNRDRTPVQPAPPAPRVRRLALTRPRRPPTGRAGTIRGPRRRAITRGRGRRPNHHPPSALRRPHDGDPLAHAPGRGRRRHGDRGDRRVAGRHPAAAHPDRGECQQPRSGAAGLVALIGAGAVSGAGGCVL